MKRVLLGILAVVFALVPVAQIAQAEADHSSADLVIYQAYFGSPIDATDEFMVLHNTSLAAVDISGLVVEYKSATGKSWYEKAKVAAGSAIAAGEDYVLATKRERNGELDGGFAQSGGNVRIVSSAGEIIDTLAWGTGDSAEGSVAPSVAPGQALTRKSDVSGQLIDTQNNLADFEVINMDIVTEVPSNPDVTSPAPMQLAIDTTVEITELFPDPTSPATDSSDEFIELFNAGTEAALLNGWKLRDAAGHASSLDGVSLQSGQYLALMSSQTKISLNNSGDTVSLINPAGEIVMTTPDYGAAQEGLTYGSSAEGWGWLATPTPNAANSSLASQDIVAAAATKAKAKKTSVKSTKKKAKSAKAKTPKLAKTAAASAANNNADMVDAQSEPVPWTWLVAGLGVLAVGYGVYEYRPEITSFFAKLRAKLSARS